MESIIENYHPLTREEKQRIFNQKVNIWENLAAQIINRAILDYKDTLEYLKEKEEKGCTISKKRRKKCNDMIMDCEHFFQSEQFELLSDELDGVYLMNEIKANVEREY